jgi:hypothetical protein
LLDAGPQKQGAEVLFNGARADVELSGDFFVAAARDQQLQNVLIAACDFDLLQINHRLDSLPRFARWLRGISTKARLSPNVRHPAQKGKALRTWALQGASIG